MPKYMLRLLIGLIVCVICVMLLYIWSFSPIVSIDDPQCLHDAAAKLPKLFHVNGNDSVYIFRRMAHRTDITTEFVTPDNNEVVVPIPEVIRVLEPSDILIASNVVVLQLRGGGIALDRGICIFLDLESEQIEYFVRRLNLSILDRDAQIYQFDLDDVRAIIDIVSDMHNTSLKQGV